MKYVSEIDCVEYLMRMGWVMAKNSNTYETFKENLLTDRPQMTKEEALKVVLDFVERYNKCDKEVKVAEAVRILEQ